MRKSARNRTIRFAAQACFAAVAFACAPASHVLAQPASSLGLERGVWAPMHAPPPERLPPVIASRSAPAAFASPGVPSLEPGPPSDIRPQMANWSPAVIEVVEPATPDVTFEDVMPSCNPMLPRRTPSVRESLRAPAPLPWLAEPLSFSKSAGGFGSDEPIERQLHNGIGLITEVRFGWDFAPRWGVESRLAFARTSLGAPAPDQLVSHENFWFLDAAFCYYPFPDTMWRPFIFAGAGMTDVKYIDQAGLSLHQWLFHIPVGFGIKRQIYGIHAFRIDVNDNLLFTDSRPSSVLNNLSIVAGFELRFGGGWDWIHAGGHPE